MSGTVNGTHQVIIEPGRVEKNYWQDLWRFRELFLVLAWRDVTVRYKQTVIGLAWAVIRPLLTIAVFTIVFGRIAKLPSEGATPYALLVCAGTLPWMFFSSALTEASNSLVANSNLISKVYFPRLIVPTASVVVAVIDLLISLAIVAVMMAIYGFAPDARIVALPLFMAMLFFATLGPALWLTTLNVRYRDFRYVIPFVTQFGLYISPVGFTSSVVPDQWRLLYSFNPMVAVIDGFRWSLLGGQASLWLPGFAVGLAVVFGFMWLGIRQFRRLEKTFADLI